MSTTSGITRENGQLTISGDVDVESDVYFPMNGDLLRDLIGKVLTHVDALGLPDTQGKAAKDLLKQSVYRWFAGVQENSMTSYRGCIAPIEVLFDNAGDARKYVWHAEGDHAISM